MTYTNAFIVLSTVSSTFLFLYGFFPIMNSSNNKSSLLSLPSELKSHNQNQQEMNFNITDLYKKRVDKLVFVVIDGLRYDFVSHKSMQYTTSMIEANECFIQVKVSSPTVTMPRLKSLMTGKLRIFDYLNQ